MKLNIWNRKDKQALFEIRGVLHSDYAKTHSTRQNVIGIAVFLKNGVTITKRKMQESASLSVMLAELMAATSC
jgi:hypothetical protein